MRFNYHSDYTTYKFYIRIEAFLDGVNLCLKLYDADMKTNSTKSTQIFFLLRLIKWLPRISGNLVVKSKLPPQNSPSLETVERHPWKRGHKVFLWLQVYFYKVLKQNMLCTLFFSENKSIHKPTKTIPLSTEWWWT